MKILLIDDDSASRKSLAKFLSVNLGHDVTTESSCDSAIMKLEDNYFPVIITDIKMQGMDGLSFLREIKSNKSSAKSEVILITGHACLDDAIEALRLGASDYLLKPLNIRKLAEIIETIAADKKDAHVFEQTQEVSTKLQTPDSILTIKDFGKAGFFSNEMQSIRDFAMKLNQHREISAMIEGDTGTGKEIIARLIHNGSKGSNLPFVCLNCAAISAGLFESELFGYARGAFTGADPKGKAGKLEMAQGGTLFLDEIADMPLDVQPKLLRVLQEREFYRIAGNKKIKLDIRVIAATNCNLNAKVNNGLFRKDLYYRLATAKIEILPLRERKRDVIGLANMFLKELRDSNDKFILISDSAKKILLAHEWEGNIRELHAVIERICLNYSDTVLRGNYLEEVMETNLNIPENMFNIELPESELPLIEIEKKIAIKVLKLKKNNISQTAKYLNISRNKLKRLLEK